MKLDEAFNRALAEAKNSTRCQTCQLIEDGETTDDKLAEWVSALGAPKVSAFIRAELGDAPGPDAIRRHLANHVA